MRYFKYVELNKLNNNKYEIINENSNRYHISKTQSPLDAAKKVFSKISSNIGNKKVILYETTHNSDKALYFYKGYREKLNNPKKIKFKNREVLINYKNIVKACKKKELGHPQVLRYW